MAVTIGYEGYGVVADADSISSDSQGGVWLEDGGGSRYDNEDVYIYAGASPPQSVGSKYASKQGYTYFDATSSWDFTSGGTGSGTNKVAGQYVYMWLNISAAGAFDDIANDGFCIALGSATNALSLWTIAGGDDANGWTGGWKLFVLDPTKTPTSTDGSLDIGNISYFGVWIDTTASVRAESIFQSQIMVATGLRVTGTSTTLYDDIVAWCIDYNNRAAGMFQKRGQTYYSLGELIIGDTASQSANTAVSASGNNIEYEKSEYYNSSGSWVTAYPIDSNVITIEEHASYTTDVDLTNVGLAGNNINLIDIVTTNATSFDMSGGYLKYINSTALTSNDSIEGVVITLSNEIDPGGADFNLVTISNTLETTTGSLLINSSAEATACTNMTFSGYSNNARYAVYVAASVTSFTMDNWVFDDPDDTTDVAVHWLGTSGTLTISATNGTNLVTAGCDAETGGTVVVVNNVQTNLTGMKDNTEVRVYTKGTTTELAGIENATAGTTNNRSYSFSLTASSNIDIRIFNIAYEPADILDYTVGTLEATLPIQQVYDPNYST